jgi:hypothetical protein
VGLSTNAPQCSSVRSKFSEVPLMCGMCAIEVAEIGSQAPRRVILVIPDCERPRT